MGGSASTEEVSGIRVFSVTPASPAAEAGLETFFDFIVECNGTRFDNPAKRQTFTKIIQESEGGMVKMKVFNTRVHDVREVTVLPRRWAGTGLLGATVRHDVADPGENHGIRVLDVFQNSPAARAGLVSFQDFMLGTPDRVFHDCDDLAEVLLSNLGKQLHVYVYNITTELIREVTLEPNNHWGGEGCIGCGTGTGLLHRLPGSRYPPGFIRGAPGQLPAGVAAPGGIPSVVPAVPVVPAMPAVPGIPPVPVAPEGASAGLPAISVSGAWAPAAAPAATNGVPAPAGFPTAFGVAAPPAPPAAAPMASMIPPPAQVPASELPPVAPDALAPKPGAAPAPPPAAPASTAPWPPVQTPVVGVTWPPPQQLLSTTEETPVA